MDRQPDSNVALPQGTNEAVRPETGPMQFGDDWPGVFIRGDNALMFYLPAVDAAVKALGNVDNFADAMTRMALVSLCNVLQTCAVRQGQEPQDVQLARLESATKRDAVDPVGATAGSGASAQADHARQERSVPSLAETPAPDAPKGWDRPCDGCGNPNIGQCSLCGHFNEPAPATPVPPAGEAQGHVCGLAGYNGMIDPPCPGCEHDALRQAGCNCHQPLLGYRPGHGPRCRLCNTLAASPAPAQDRERAGIAETLRSDANWLRKRLQGDVSVATVTDYMERAANLLDPATAVAPETPDPSPEKKDCGCGKPTCPQLHGITLHQPAASPAPAQETPQASRYRDALMAERNYWEALHNAQPSATPEYLRAVSEIERIDAALATPAAQETPDLRTLIDKALGGDKFRLMDAQMLQQFAAALRGQRPSPDLRRLIKKWCAVADNGYPNGSFTAAQAIGICADELADALKAAPLPVQQQEP